MRALDQALEKKLPVVVNTAYQYAEGSLSLGEVSKLSTAAIGITKDEVTFYMLPGYMTPESYYVIDEAALGTLLNRLGILIVTN